MAINQDLILIKNRLIIDVENNLISDWAIKLISYFNYKTQQPEKRIHSPADGPISDNHWQVWTALDNWHGRSSLSILVPWDVTSKKNKMTCKITVSYHFKLK